MLNWLMKIIINKEVKRQLKEENKGKSLLQKLEDNRKAVRNGGVR